MASKREITLNDEPRPKNIQRADIAPSDGFALVVDGRLKTKYDDEATPRRPRRFAEPLSEAAGANLQRRDEDALGHLRRLRRNDGRLTKAPCWPLPLW